MTHPSHYSRFEKFLLWYGSKPTIVAALIGGFLTASFSVITVLVVMLAVAAHRAAFHPIISLSLFVYIFIITTVTLIIVTPRVRKRLDTALGISLTDRDRIDLAAWVRTGIKPQNTAIHARLGDYLDYLEPFINGTNVFAAYGDRRKILQKILFGIFAAVFLLYVVIFIIDPHSRGQFNTYFQLALMLCFMYLYNPFSDKPKRLYALLNGRNIARITRRRQELDAEEL